MDYADVDVLGVFCDGHALDLVSYVVQLKIFAGPVDAEVLLRGLSPEELSIDVPEMAYSDVVHC